MRVLFRTLLFFFLAESCFGEWYIPTIYSPSGYPDNRRSAGELQASQDAWSNGIKLSQQQQAALWANFLPEDPYRVIDDKTILAKGNRWVKFGGKIIGVLPNGIRVKGGFISLNDPFNYYTYRGEYFVENFPYTNNLQILGDEKFSAFTAKEAGDSTRFETNTIPKLSYGLIGVPPPPTADEIATVVQNADSIVVREQNKNETTAKSLKWNQDQATKGDAFGLFRMGERFLTGDGVDKDMVKAREFFSKAAVAGSTSAIEMLQKLDSQTVSK